MGQLLKKRISSRRRKFFSLRGCLFKMVSVIKGIKQEVIKVVSLCKNGRKTWWCIRIYHNMVIYGSMHFLQTFFFLFSDGENEEERNFINHDELEEKDRTGLPQKINNNNSISSNKNISNNNNSSGGVSNTNSTINNNNNNNNSIEEGDLPVNKGKYFVDSHHTVPYKFYVLEQVGLSKQCRPRSDCF